MSKYKKVSKDDVFKIIVLKCLDVMGIGMTPPALIRYRLKTSKYQIYKYANELISEGLIQRTTFTVEKEHQYEPEDCLPIICYELTTKATKTEIYKTLSNVSSEEFDMICINNLMG